MQINSRHPNGTVHAKGTNDLRVTKCHKFLLANTDTTDAVTCKRCSARLAKETS